MRYHFTTNRIAIKKKGEYSISENVEKLVSWYIAGGNIKWWKTVLKT